MSVRMASHLVHHHLHRMLFGCVLAGAMLSWYPLWAILPPAREVFPVAIEVQGDVGRSWNVKQAEITEDFNTLWASLKVENISNLPVRQALFYGEYYDRRGRLCYTAFFDLQKNEGRLTGPALPRSSRTLVSISFNMAAGSRPRLVKLFLIRQFPTAEGTNRPANESGTLVPPMLQATSEQPWQVLCLGHAYRRPVLPVVDIALMLVDVDATGSVRSFKVLDAVATVPFVSWAEEFASHIRFSPARRNRELVEGKTLVLFRALLREWTKDDPAEVASSNPWIARYIETEAPERIPLVSVVVLQPPPPHTAPTQVGSESGCVQYLGTGTYWSDGITLDEYPKR